ncbi:MAG: Patatin [Acidobacteria bacterium]|nr:MAG: Patatin [Acidobacteriota bacterium]
MDSNNQGRKRVAIACQGGGSHTAFTAGVLQGLLEAMPKDVDVVALSGASGGAICAALAWDGLVRNDHKLAVRKLQGFWDAIAATDPLDRIGNESLTGIMGLRDLMVMPEVSPYHLPTWGEDRFRQILNDFFDFSELRMLARRQGAPILQIGAVEVLSGHFELFTGEELCVECLLASAAIPELFRAVSVPGRGVFWDGLFSQNPPIHDLVRHRLDELWLIQINLSTCPRIPTETHEILDRRNALSGNLSMEQEIGFIEMLNKAITTGRFKDPDFGPIRISRIVLDRELGYRSKIDRRPELLEDLTRYGQTKCRMFLKDRESRTKEQERVLAVAS